MTDKEEAPDLEKIENKLDKGEALSPEEEKLLQEGDEVDAPEAEPKKVVIEPKKEAKPEDTPSEKDTKAPEVKEKEDADAAAKQAERKKVIEADAEKPLDEVDIKDYSPTERALFFELRKERRKRQDSQREADTLKFQRAKEEARIQVEKEREAEEARKKAEEEADPFKDLDDDDLLTAGQMKKILAGKTKAPEKPSDSDQKVQKLIEENWLLKAKEKAPDLLAVLKHTDALLVNDQDATEEVKDVIRRGGNPFLATYNLIKAHPKWKEIEGSPDNDADKKAEDEARMNKERAERIEANKKKPVTTGAGGGAPASGEYTIQELLDLPDAEFARLPKAQREKILEAL